MKLHEMIREHYPEYYSIERYPATETSARIHRATCRGQAGQTDPAGEDLARQGVPQMDRLDADGRQNGGCGVGEGRGGVSGRPRRLLQRVASGAVEA